MVGNFYCSKNPWQKGDFWEKVDGERYGASKVDLSHFMTHGQFPEVRSWILMLWADEDKKESLPCLGGNLRELSTCSTKTEKIQY